jgi:hypothetical protein
MSLSSFSQQMVEACARRQTAGMLLLFLISHRPLAFACGQLLYAAHPLAALFDIDACAELAADLSEPDSARRLEIALNAAAGSPQPPAP